MGMNLCRGCNQIFGSLKAFDTHRIGGYGDPIYKPSSTGKSQNIIGYTPHTRHCMTEEEILARGMKKEAHGWWILNAMDQALLARLRGETVDPDQEDEEEEDATLEEEIA